MAQVAVATTEDMKAHVGNSIFFDLVDFDQVHPAQLS